MSDVILSAGTDSVTLHGSGRWAEDGLALTSIQGWYETPDTKTDLVERSTGDGAHDLSDMEIMYEARTVTLGYRAIVGASRSKALDQLTALGRMVHRMVRVRVVDDGQDTFCDGYASIDLDQSIQNPSWQDVSGVVNIVCPRPERLSWTAQKRQVSAALKSFGGLYYGPDAKGLVYDVTYGASVADQRNVCTIVNRGSSRAYPVFTVNGGFDLSVSLGLTANGTSSTLTFDTFQGGSAPVVLDTRSRTASRGGVDVTELVSRRGWQTVPPNGSMTVVLNSAGDGWVDVECRDTWM